MDNSQRSEGVRVHSRRLATIAGVLQFLILDDIRMSKVALALKLYPWTVP